MQTTNLSLKLLLLLLLLLHCYVAIYVDVVTETGRIRGQTLDMKNPALDARVDQFLGIPYAEPPIGERRFSKPVPITASERVLYHKISLIICFNNIIFLIAYHRCHQTGQLMYAGIGR